MIKSANRVLKSGSKAFFSVIKHSDLNEDIQKMLKEIFQEHNILLDF